MVKKNMNFKKIKTQRFILRKFNLNLINRNYLGWFKDPHVRKFILFKPKNLKSLKNDVLKIVGHPHSKSINNDNEWLYFERTLIKGQFHKLGKNVLKDNNVLILNFNNYGILVKKEFLDKNDKKKLKFSEKITKNDLSQKSFVERFLTSIKSKMYGNK